MKHRKPWTFRRRTMDELLQDISTPSGRRVRREFRPSVNRRECIHCLELTAYYKEMKAAK